MSLPAIRNLKLPVPAIVDHDVIEAHKGEPLRIATNINGLVVDVCNYLNLKEPPTDQQVQILTDFVAKEFGNLTTDDVMLAFRKAASGKLNIDSNQYANLSIFYWGKVLAAYEVFVRDVDKQSQAYESRPEYRGLTPDEFVSSGTKAKVDKLLEELAAKKTAWRKEKVRPSINHSEMYDIRCREFAMKFADKFGSRDTARKAWELRIDRRRWNESKDLAWVDVELAKLAD